jgi:hypothetical protein
MAKVTIDTKQIVAQAIGKPKKDRVNHTFRFQEDLYQKFKRKCGSAKPTKVLEALMKSFIGEE